MDYFLRLCSKMLLFLVGFCVLAVYFIFATHKGMSLAGKNHQPARHRTNP